MSLEKTLQLTKKLLKIARVCTIVIGLIVIAAILVVFNTDLMSQQMTGSVLLGNLKVILTQQGMTETMLNLSFLPWSVVVIVAYCIIFYLSLRELGIIVDQALQSSVFEKQISTGLSHLAWYVIAGGVVNLVSTFFSAVRLNAMNLAALFNPWLVSGIEMQYTVNLKFLAVAFVLFLLSKVFAYGATLQQLSDETL